MRSFFSSIVALVVFCRLTNAAEFGGAPVVDPDRLQALQIWATAPPGYRVVVQVVFATNDEHDVSVFDHASGSRIHFFNNLCGPAPGKTGTWFSEYNTTDEPRVYAICGNHISTTGPSRWALDWYQVLAGGDEKSYVGLEAGDNEQDFNDASLIIYREPQPKK
jgi:hypothetical protein